MKTNIETPKLTEAQLSDVLQRYAAGQSVKRIAIETKAAYTAVYFHTVGGGRILSSVRVCRCGAEHYAAGLCKPCYYRAYRARRRGAILMAAKRAA